MIEKIKRKWFMVVFVLSLVTWSITALINTLGDIFTGQFDHKVLSYSLIVSILCGGYLKGKEIYINRKLKKLGGVKSPKECKKCGKKKATNV